MPKDMFFIPLMAKAFSAPDRRRAIKEALEEMARMGTQGEYERGRGQCERFLAAARPVVSGRVRASSDSTHIELDVPFPADVELMVPGLQPGRCIVTLNTGLVVAELDLTAEDLIWDAAFGATDLRMAADTEEDAVCCAQTYRMQRGAGEIRTYPGIESGSIGIIFVRREPKPTVK